MDWSFLNPEYVILRSAGFSPTLVKAIRGAKIVNGEVDGVKRYKGIPQKIARALGTRRLRGQPDIDAFAEYINTSYAPAGLRDWRWVSNKKRTGFEEVAEKTSLPLDELLELDKIRNKLPNSGLGIETLQNYQRLGLETARDIAVAVDDGLNAPEQIPGYDKIGIKSWKQMAALNKAKVPPEIAETYLWIGIRAEDIPKTNYVMLSAETVKEFQAAGVTDLDEIIGHYKILLNPEDCKGYISRGITRSTQINALHAGEVPPRAIDWYRQAGIVNPEDMLVANEHKITPPAAIKLSRAGFNLQEMISLATTKSHRGMMPEPNYREMTKLAGTVAALAPDYANVGFGGNVELILELNELGITPEFVRRQKAFLNGRIPDEQKELFTVMVGAYNGQRVTQ